MKPRRKAYLLALAVWPLFLVTAITLGGVRENLIAPALGEQAAHVIGTLFFIAVMLTTLCGSAIIAEIQNRVRQQARG